MKFILDEHYWGSIERVDEIGDKHTTNIKRKNEVAMKRKLEAVMSVKFEPDCFECILVQYSHRDLRCSVDLMRQWKKRQR